MKAIFNLYGFTKVIDIPDTYKPPLTYSFPIIDAIQTMIQQAPMENAMEIRKIEFELVDVGYIDSEKIAMYNCKKRIIVG